MKTHPLFRALALLLLGFFLVGATECQQDSKTVVAPQLPATQSLLAEKDRQLEDLKKQEADLKSQRDAERQNASKAASNFQGVLKAAEYLPESPPKEAVVDESKLGITRLPADDPQETVRALQRVVLIVTGQRDEARKLYDAAAADAIQAKAVIAEKDKALAAKDAEIGARDTRIAELNNAMLAGQKKAAADLQNAFAAKDAEIQKLKDEQAAKERRLWVNTLRIGSVGIVLAGIAAIAISQGALWVQGGLLVLGGALLFGFGIAIDILTSQWWFPYAAGFVALLVLAGGGWWIYELWKTDRLNDKVLAAVQDIRSTSEATGSKLWAEVREHFIRRLGGSNGYWGRVIQQKLVQKGLIAGTGPAAPAAPAAPPPRPA
jgi:hypothetical protein